eukprot:2657443-Rhodomonas_salina.1
MSGTDLAYHPTSRPTLQSLSPTPLPLALFSGSDPPRSAYARAMRCPVLKCRRCDAVCGPETAHAATNIIRSVRY